jgi:hypothetical protein
LLLAAAFGQVATPTTPDQITYSAAVRLGDQGSFNADGVVGNVGVFGRSLAGAWDIGAEALLFRSAIDIDNAGQHTTGGLDLGTVAIYGSAGAKLAGEAGFFFADATGHSVWVKGTVGNFQAVSGGFGFSRISISGAYGNYFENRGDVGVRLDRAGHYTLTAGWSSALGWNGGVLLSFTRSKP